MSNKPTKFTNEPTRDRTSERTNGLFECWNRDIENGQRLFSKNGKRYNNNNNNNNAQTYNIHQSSGNHVHTNKFMYGNHLGKSEQKKSNKILSFGSAISQVHIITFHVFQKEHHNICNRKKNSILNCVSKFLCH